jgi:hypothetical protein
MGGGMARGSCTFKQQDVTRLLKATVAAGIEVERIEIDRDGKMVVVAAKQLEQVNERRGAHEWDNL